MYRIREENGREMDSLYYAQELQAINRDPNPYFLIERILQDKEIEFMSNGWDIQIIITVG